MLLYFLLDVKKKKGNRCEMGQAGEKNLIEAKDVGVCVFKKKRGGGRGGKKKLSLFW